MLDRNLYCFWFGDSMSQDRARCYQSIVDNSNVNVILVGDHNLKKFEIEHHPFHPAFNLLTTNHKSDYLRAYFMYFYGGGYTDIKNTEFDWNPYFDLLEKSDKVAIGYREESPNDINYPPAKLIYEQIIGTCSFIHKQWSSIARKWLEGTELIMTEKYSDLILKNSYPFEYTELGGDVWHKVQHENLDLWLFDLARIDIRNYK